MKTYEYITDVMIGLIGIYEPILQSIRRIKLNSTVIQLYMTTPAKQSSKVWFRVIANVLDPTENGLMI